MPNYRHRVSIQIYIYVLVLVVVDVHSTRMRTQLSIHSCVKWVPRNMIYKRDFKIIIIPSTVILYSFLNTQTDKGIWKAWIIKMNENCNARSPPPPRPLSLSCRSCQQSRNTHAHTDHFVSHARFIFEARLCCFGENNEHNLYIPCNQHNKMQV